MCPRLNVRLVRCVEVLLEDFLRGLKCYVLCMLHAVLRAFLNLLLLSMQDSSREYRALVGTQPRRLAVANVNWSTLCAGQPNRCNFALPASSQRTGKAMRKALPFQESSEEDLGAMVSCWGSQARCGGSLAKTIFRFGLSKEPSGLCCSQHCRRLGLSPKPFRKS